MTTMHEQVYRSSPNWRQISTYLGLTFGLTFLLDLVLYLTLGYGATAGAGMLLQVQMLIPAVVAIALQLFVFRDSSIFHIREMPRWFFYFYLAFALFYALMALSVALVNKWASPSMATTYTTVASVALQILNIAGLILLVVLRLAAGREAFRRAGLAFGRIKYYLSFGLLLVVVYAGMTGLNALFGLGQTVDVQEFIRQAAGGRATGMEGLSGPAILLITGVQAVLLSPILALLIAFGEEYGWRGYLQSELIKLGKVRGILLLGVIWGLWHAPVILMGHNYPGYPVWGVLLMTLYTIALAFLFGFAVLRSGSVWLAAYLHALNNQMASFLFLMVYRPNDLVFSFGSGLYGLVIWAAVVGLILVLGRKEWRTPAQPAVPQPTDGTGPGAERLDGPTVAADAPSSSKADDPFGVNG